MSTVIAHPAVAAASAPESRYRGWGIVLAGVAIAAVLVLGFSSLEALRAAGINGTAPPNAAAIEKLISSLTDNAKWFIITGIGGFLVFVIMFFMFGSQRAPDYLGKVVMGLLALIVGIPALLA